MGTDLVNGLHDYGDDDLCNCTRWSRVTLMQRQHGWPRGVSSPREERDTRSPTSTGRQPTAATRDDSPGLAIRPVARPGPNETPLHDRACLFLHPGSTPRRTVSPRLGKFEALRYGGALGEKITLITLPTRILRVKGPQCDRARSHADRLGAASPT